MVAAEPPVDGVVDCLRYAATRPGVHGSIPGLLGRGADLAVIDALLANGEQDSSALLLRGEPGVGKTSLLNATATRAEARGMRVLRACGVQGEAALAFSTLHQLIRPTRGHIADLADHQQDTLSRTSDVGPGRAPERLAVSAAVLALLDRSAAERPLLLLIDDLHWVDRRSAEVLGFVARRLRGEPAVFVAAGGTWHTSPVYRVGLAERVVEPLTSEWAAALMDRRHPSLPSAVRSRLLAEAAGNPLALLELPRSLSRPQLAGREVLPALLPLSRRLEALFASRIRALPALTRFLLLLAALDGTQALEPVRSAAGHRWRIDGLTSAERGGLIQLNSGRLVFQHPLVRAAVVQVSAPHQRCAAERALAATSGRQPQDRSGYLPVPAPETDVGAARAELTAHQPCGGAVASAAALTVQERRIAHLAATGLSNKQIGARLHLSPRTVSTHLYKIFPKLGITSRAALHTVLRLEYPT